MNSTPLSRRHLLAVGASLPLAAAPIGRALAQAAPQVCVVELFTSQGCSSCPPSDAFLGELAKRTDVLALSFHVDYWDYIGWKDPYAAPEFTARQRGYAKTLRQRYVYTPEMVVHGYAHDSGHDRTTVLELIRGAGQKIGPQVGPVLAFERDTLLVNLPEFAAAQRGADLWLASYDPQLKTKVERGENRGRDLINYNVVRSLASLGVWSGKAAQLRVGADKLGAGAQLALIVQQPDLGPIMGCARAARVA